jgi:fructokinase
LFIVAGEALIDLMSVQDGSYRPAIGGAPYNFARALALQGVPAGYLNPLSTDRFGLLLAQGLADAGVRQLGAVSAKPTSLALVSADDKGQPSYSFYRAAIADRELTAADMLKAMDGPIAGLHTGGLALLPPDHETVLTGLSYAGERGVPRTLDVNLRLQVAASMGVEPAHYRDAVFAAIKQCDILKVSDEDLRHLGLNAEPKAAARELLAYGPRLAVLTLGASGAWVLSPQQALFQPADQVPVVDTVGAGDCFFAGFVAALLRDNGIAMLFADTLNAELLIRALAHATRCAAINISRQGCQPPTWDDALKPVP